ncbi:MAG: hypothetical protein P8Y99_03330 [Calditrichaceae bacterium]
MDNTEYNTPNKSDLSISLKQANILSVYFVIPVILMLILYLIVWGFDDTLNYILYLKTRANITWVIVSIVAGIIAHELLHGIAWMYFVSMAASGDALILCILRKVQKGKLVADHPTRAGCYVIE